MLVAFTIVACLVCVGRTDAAVSGTFERLAVSPLWLLPRAQAVDLSTKYTGFSAEKVTAADYGRATDAYGMSSNTTSRDVWQVVYSGISITAIGKDGKEQTNPNIHAITVWLEARTGALLRVSTPKPALGGLNLAVRSSERELWQINGLAAVPTIVPPRDSFSSSSTICPSLRPGMALKATEIVAYFGLLTDTMVAPPRFADQPHWLVLADGLEYPVSGGPRGAQVPPAKEGVVAVNADTGAIYRHIFVSAGLSRQN